MIHYTSHSAMDPMILNASELYAAQGFHALIGRDILSQCGFVYNGSGFFTLAN